MQCSILKNVVTMKDFKLQTNQADVSYRARMSSIREDKSFKLNIFKLGNKNSLASTNKQLCR